MQNESADINFNEEIGKIFGVDYIEILPKNELKFKVNVVVMHPTTITNFYKLFNSFIDEMERAKDETSALNAIDDAKDLLGIQDVQDELNNCQTENILENNYYRFYQEYDDIPVYGLHREDGLQKSRPEYT